MPPLYVPLVCPPCTGTIVYRGSDPTKTTVIKPELERLVDTSMVDTSSVDTSSVDTSGGTGGTVGGGLDAGLNAGLVDALFDGITFEYATWSRPNTGLG